MDSSRPPLQPWMPVSTTDRHFDKDVLRGLESLDKFYIYQNIQIFDKLFDCPRMTDHCFTVRSRSYQQIFLVGTAGNRKPGTVLPFTLRAVDQYNRLVIVIRKHFKHCFNKEVIHIECPVGNLVAKVVKHKDVKHEPLLSVFEPQLQQIKFTVLRGEDKRNRNEFKILNKIGEKIASISKRYEKFMDRDKSLLYEDHYIRVTVESQSRIEVNDKAILLSTALILHFLDQHLKEFELRRKR